MRGLANLKMRGWLLIALLMGCSEGDPLEPGVLSLTVGQEADTWAADPAPVEVTVDRILDDGTRRPHKTLAAPAERVPLPQMGIAQYEVRGTDVEGVTQVFGRSLRIDAAGFAGSGLSLFVGRTGRFSRPPGDLAAPPGESVHAVLLGGRYLLVSGESPESHIQIGAYDFGTWEAAAGGPRFTCPKEPCKINTLALVRTTALAIGDGWAIWFDPTTFTSGDAPLPDGLSSYDELGGGAQVIATDGTVYVVGATRPELPTRAVLRIERDGLLTALTLGTARAGASATWVRGRGLVVAGGSGTGSGVELLADGADAFVPLGYSADATTGAALVELDTTAVLRIGGKDSAGIPSPTLAFSLDCGTSCSPEARGDSVELDRATGFRLADESLIVVGTAAAGETGAARMSGGVATALAFRDPRRGAIALGLPIGMVAVVGGVRPDGSPAPSIELLVP